MAVDRFVRGNFFRGDRNRRNSSLRVAPYSGTGSVRGYFSQMAAEAELKDRIAVWGTIKCWKLAVWPTFCAIIGKSVIRRA